MKYTFKKLIIATIVIATFANVPQAVAAPAGSAHSVGTNVIENGVVYRIQLDGTRAPYTSAGAFLSYKFNNFGSVQIATDGDIQLPISIQFESGAATTTYYVPPKSGSLINDKGTIYQILSSAAKVGFANSSAFLGMGYSFNYAKPGDTSFIPALPAINNSSIQHQPGSLVNERGTLYIIAEQSRLGVPTMEALDSWGYWPYEAVAANSYDAQLPVIGVLAKRTVAKTNVYDLEMERAFSGCGATLAVPTFVPLRIVQDVHNSPFGPSGDLPGCKFSAGRYSIVLLDKQSLPNDSQWQSPFLAFNRYQQSKKIEELISVARPDVIGTGPLALSYKVDLNTNAVGYTAGIYKKLPPAGVYQTATEIQDRYLVFQTYYFFADDDPSWVNNFNRNFIR